MKPQRFPFSVSYWTGDQGQVVDLCAGRNFRFDLDALNHFCLEDLPSRLVDFLRIASSIYVVDRLVKRHPQHGAKRPSRAIGIRVNVLNKPFWSRPEVRDTIGEAVDFVSGDFSDVDFSQDTFRFARSMRMLPNPYDGQPPLICLFSGGQDSAAGLVARLMEGSERIVLPVSVWHQPRQRDLLHKQFGMLRERLPVRIDPLIVKVAMIWSSDLDKKQEERSQRCRSFLFATLGAIAAIMNRQKSVEMFESGVGAINMPLMAGMVGSKATRSSHPQFLRLMSRLASLVAETNIEFCLPFLHRTKGEVTKVLADFGLHALAVKTTSCVGYPLRHSLAKQCGICPACIFRRQAMLTAGISEPNGSYKYDILGPPFLTNRIPSQRLNYLKAFLMQVAQLKDVELDDRLPRTFERHVLSTSILQHCQSQIGLIDLLARYRDEWMTIASNARQQGYAWARWLAPHQPKQQEKGVACASA